MENLRAIRKQRGLSQTQLAEAVGCNQATISKIEKGGNFTHEMGLRIAKVLGVPLVDLFSLSDVEARYLRALREASPERRSAVLVLLSESDQPTEG